MTRRNDYSFVEEFAENRPGAIPKLDTQTFQQPHTNRKVRAIKQRKES